MRGRNIPQNPGNRLVTGDRRLWSSGAGPSMVEEVGIEVGTEVGT